MQKGTSFAAGVTPSEDCHHCVSRVILLSLWSCVAPLEHLRAELCILVLTVQTVSFHAVTYLFLQIKALWGGVLIISHSFLNNRLAERAKRRRTSLQYVGQAVSDNRQEDGGPVQVRQEASCSNGASLSSFFKLWGL